MRNFPVRNNLFFAIFIGICVWVTPALARSGGRMGGGFSSSRSSSSRPSFGGGSSSRSSFGSSSSSSSSYHPSAPSPSYGGSSTRYIPIPVPIGGGGYGYGSGSYGAGHPSYYYGSSGRSSSAGIWVFLFFVVLIAGTIAVLIFINRRRQAAGAELTKVDVFEIQFGIAAQARQIQGALEQLAETLNFNDQNALARLTREVALEIQRNIQNVEYGFLKQTPKLMYDKAEALFRSHSSDERAKYNREVITNDEGGVRKRQKEMTTDGLRDEDGDFAIHEYFVVTLLLAVRNFALTANLNDARGLEAVVAQLSQITGQQIVAAEVIWSPAALSDALGKEEMILQYPNLFLI